MGRGGGGGGDGDGDDIYAEFFVNRLGSSDSQAGNASRKFKVGVSMFARYGIAAVVCS